MSGQIVTKLYLLGDEPQNTGGGAGGGAGLGSGRPGSGSGYGTIDDSISDPNNRFNDGIITPDIVTKGSYDTTNRNTFTENQFNVEGKWKIHNQWNNFIN